jgi:predicted nucleotidyltransferase
MDKKSAINCARTYAKKVKDDLSFNRIYLFGSFVNDTATEDSDIDVAIIVDDFDKEGSQFDWLATSSRLWRLTEGVSFDIEPILLDINHDTSGFASKIIKTGVSLV